MKKIKIIFYIMAVFSLFSCSSSKEFKATKYMIENRDKLALLCNTVFPFVPGIEKEVVTVKTDTIIRIDSVPCVDKKGNPVTKVVVKNKTIRDTIFSVKTIEIANTRDKELLIKSNQDLAVEKHKNTELNKAIKTKNKHIIILISILSVIIGYRLFKYYSKTI